VHTITILPGDGIGQEVTREAVEVLAGITRRYRRTFTLREALVGGAALDAVNNPLPDETLVLCKESDAVLLGAIGGPKWDSNPPELKPERGLLGLRKELGLYANLRPVKLYPSLIESSPLKNGIAEKSDLIIVRELTGGLYFGMPRGIETRSGRRIGINTMQYSEDEIKRIAVRAFEIAMIRRQNVCSVDKANVLETSQLWRKVVTEVAADYPDIELSHMYVDNCAMQLIRNPSQFDVILTENLFGDILSDEAAMLTGSIGMLPSASLGGSNGLYEPVHGSAPDIAGTDRANPIAMILSAAMMLRYSFGYEEEALCIENAVAGVLEAGYRTTDIYTSGTNQVGTREMGNLIRERI
jgi:3-isopropylmalate dehydrogenase